MSVGYHVAALTVLSGLKDLIGRAYVRRRILSVVIRMLRDWLLVSVAYS